MSGWPSSDDTLFHATVYVPLGRGFTPTESFVLSVGSPAELLLSTCAPLASSTWMLLRPAEMGSLNQIVTRAGGTPTLASASGSARTNAAWAEACTPPLTPSKTSANAATIRPKQKVRSD